MSITVGCKMYSRSRSSDQSCAYSGELIPKSTPALMFFISEDIEKPTNDRKRFAFITDTLLIHPEVFESVKTDLDKPFNSHFFTETDEGSDEICCLFCEEEFNDGENRIVCNCEDSNLFQFHKGCTHHFKNILDQARDIAIANAI